MTTWKRLSAATAAGVLLMAGPTAASASGHPLDKKKKHKTSSSCTKTSSGKCVAAGQYCAKDGAKGRDAKGQKLTCRKHHWKKS